MTIEDIKDKILIAAAEFPIKRVSLFGSQAAGTAGENSDIDLIMEFSGPVSLITMAEINQRLEALLGRNVDIVHGPIRSSDLLEINKEIEIYAA